MRHAPLAWLLSFGPLLAQSAPALPKVILVEAEGYGPAAAERLKGKAEVRLLDLKTFHALDFSRENVDVVHVRAGLDDVAPRRPAAAGGPDLLWAVEAPTEDVVKAAAERRIAIHELSAADDRAEAVADVVARRLKIRHPTPKPADPAVPKTAAEYRQREAELDARVPARWKTLPVGEFRIPASAEEWKASRPAALRAALDSLGDLPPRPSPLKSRRISRELRPGYAVEKIVLDNGVDGEIPALLLLPAGRRGPVPAVLWLHSTSPDSDQIVTPHTNGGELALGEVLTRAGYAVLAPDAYWHGDRAQTGPSGTAEPFREEHASLHKINLWMGRTLWGMFVRDDQIALDYLRARPEIDPARIGATGLSMGSTRAWWLAALDDRVACAVGVACLTRYQNLIAHGQLRQHGWYYFAFGLLRHFDTEGVIALIAPRPFLALTGELDAGSPADGIRVIEERAGQVYERLGAKERFRSVLYPEVGHTYTPAMRAEMLAWFARWLKP
jgi:dienelactone hydrolase